MGARRVIVHIGTEKTGTTSIQKFLRDNTGLLQDQGYFVPRSLGCGNHVTLCLLAQDTPPRFRTVWDMLGVADASSRDAAAAAALQAFTREIEALPETVHTVLLSNEHLHSNLFERHEIERLRGVLSPLFDEITILVYLRRQDRLATSLFSTRIKGGEPWEEPVLPPVAEGAPYYFDFKALLDNYAGVFGADAVRCRLFERAHLLRGDVVHDFCAAVGLAVRPEMQLPSAQNGSISAPALYALSLLNPHVPCFQQGHWNRNRDFLIETLEELFPGSPALVRRADAERFYAAFREANEALRRAYLPHHPAPLFSESFLEYPEDVGPTQPSARDLATVFAALWNGQADIRHGLVDELERQARDIEHADVEHDHVEQALA